MKIAVLSAASSKLIEDAMRHFRIPCAAIIGYQPYVEKPNTILGNMLQERLNIRHEQIIYVGNSKSDETQARASQFSFLGATWGSHDTDYFTEKGVQTISNPKELIAIMEDAGWKSPVQPLWKTQRRLLLLQKKNNWLCMRIICSLFIGKWNKCKRL